MSSRVVGSIPARTDTRISRDDVGDPFSEGSRPLESLTLPAFRVTSGRIIGVRGMPQSTFEAVVPEADTKLNLGARGEIIQGVFNLAKERASNNDIRSYLMQELGQYRSDKAMVLGVFMALVSGWRTQESPGFFRRILGARAVPALTNDQIISRYGAIFGGYEYEIFRDSAARECVKSLRSLGLHTMSPHERN